MNFSIEGHQFSVCVIEFPTIFGLVHHDFMKDEISTERTIAENEMPLSTTWEMSAPMAKLMVSFLSMRPSTTYSATLSLPSEVTAQVSGAQQEPYSWRFLMASLLHAFALSSGWSSCSC
jgi:hypothetical protein